MNARKIDFRYSFIRELPEFRKEVSDFVEALIPEIRNVVPSSTYISSQITGLRSGTDMPAESVSLIELANSTGETMSGVYRFLFSEKRRLIPDIVSSNRIEDYLIMEKILKDMHGDGAKISAWDRQVLLGSERKVVIPGHITGYAKYKSLIL